jgi:hypothetical protein
MATASPTPSARRITLALFDMVSVSATTPCR